MQNTDDILGQPVTSFVDRYVRSLLTWDVIVFFHRNPDQVLYLDELGARLGRSVEELSPEVANL